MGVVPINSVNSAPINLKISDDSVFVPVINITKNTDLANYSLSGNGTESNPFILNNFNLVCSLSVQYSTGISIQNTTDFFILDNFTIQDCYIGIYFHQVHHALVRDSDIKNANTGFYAVSSSDLTINNSIVQNCGVNGFLFSSISDLILQNSLVDSGSFGFDFNSLYHANVVNNSVSNHGYSGFIFRYSYYVNLSYNFASALEGFHLLECYHLILKNNTALNNSGSGFYLYYSFYNNLTNNKVYNGHGDGFRISHSSSNNLIGNEASNNTDYGFYLDSSNFNLLINNTSLNNKKGNFHSYNSKNNVLKHNSFSYNNTLSLFIDLVIIVTIIVLVFGAVIKREFNHYQLEDDEYKNETTFLTHLKMKFSSKLKSIKEKL